MKTINKAISTATGGRAGHVKSDDGKINMGLSVPKSMGGDGGAGTNPEQLFASAYAGCYGSALQACAEKMNVDLGDFSVTATVKLGVEEEGDLNLSAVLDAYIPGVDIETGEELVNQAHEICPFSRATRDNIDVTLNLMLDE